VMRPVVLSSKAPFFLQCGRTCIVMSLQEPRKSCFCACFGSKANP
jgi:hypothetical protein